MNKKLALSVLITSILCLISALILLFTGSNKSRIYNQMKTAKRIESIAGIKNSADESFLLTGYIEKDHNKVKKDLVAYTKISKGKNIKTVNPELKINLEDGVVHLKSGYDIADSNKNYTKNDITYNGIKSGIDVTVYAIQYKNSKDITLKGYEIYPGSADQYINFLSSPFNSYMIYVRVLIALAMIFFIFSIVINIKK